MICEHRQRYSSNATGSLGWKNIGGWTYRANTIEGYECIIGQFTFNNDTGQELIGIIDFKHSYLPYDVYACIGKLDVKLSTYYYQSDSAANLLLNVQHEMPANTGTVQFLIPSGTHFIQIKLRDYGHDGTAWFDCTLRAVAPASSSSYIDYGDIISSDNPYIINDVSTLSTTPVTLIPTFSSTADFIQPVLENDELQISQIFFAKKINRTMEVR